MSEIKYIKTHTFKVQNFDRVSIPKLCDQLYAVLAATPKLESTVPVAITALYGLNAAAWRQSKFSQPGWHLRLPSSFAVLNAIGNVVAASKFCTEGQIVAGNVVKYPTEAKLNILELDVHELSQPVKSDAPRFEHKLLLWYIEQCELRSKKPTFTEFQNLLDQLRKKRKTKKETEKQILQSLLNADSKIILE